MFPSLHCRPFYRRRKSRPPAPTEDSRTSAPPMLSGIITLASVAEGIPPAPVWTPPFATWVSLDPADEFLEPLLLCSTGAAGAGVVSVVVVSSLPSSSPAKLAGTTLSTSARALAPTTIRRMSGLLDMRYLLIVELITRSKVPCSCAPQVVQRRSLGRNDLS